jgi:ADP-heptose:LPS heptosyltransferase
MSIAGIKNRISYGITGGGFLLTCNVRYDRLQHEALKDLKLLSAIGIKEKKANIEIFYDKEELASADLVKRSAGLVGPYAVIHAVAGQDEKMWSIDNFFEVTRYVRDIKKLLPVFIGSAKDKIFIHEIIGLLAGGAVDLSGSTGLKITAKLIADATLFIGLDSGPAHIASATDTPSIVLFSGINSLDQWAPAGENIDIISPGENRNLSEVTSEEVCRAIDKRIGIKIAGKDKI